MKKCLLFVFSVCCNLMMAQDPFYINYSIDDGLPSATVYSVSQDENGYLWFTTDAGIVKFDSHSFALFNTDNGLSDNEVFHIKKDFKGRKWLLTLNGKPSFFYKNQIYNESNSSLVRKISGSSLIIDLYEDKQHTLYFVYRNGEIAVVTPNNQVSFRNVKATTLCGVWTSQGRLFILNGKGGFDVNANSYLPNFGASSNYRMYHIGTENYFSRNNMLYKIGPNNELYNRITIPDAVEIIDIYIENVQKTWVCTRNGLYLYENQILQKKYFSELSISGIIKDFEGGYWISTLKKGVFYVPSFAVFAEQFGSPEALKLNCISISPDKEIWIGGDRNDYYRKKEQQPFLKNTFVTHGGVNKVANIRFYNNNTYVIGKLGVIKITPENRITNIGFSANDILIDNKNFYVGCSFMYKVPTNDSAILNPILKNSDMLINKRVMTITKGNPEIWIGSNYGLFQYTKKDSVVYWGDKNLKLQTSIQDLYYDASKKSLFVATGSRGIIIINDKKVVRQVSTKDGLNSITCNTLKKIAENYYLIGSNNGLNSVSFEKNAIRIKNLNAILGLHNKKINDIDFLDNIVYLATDNGLLHFSIKNIEQKKTRPICLIESLKNHDKTFSGNLLHQFNYDNNDISINYIGISYSNGNDLTYYYQLNGQRDSWSSTKESRINYKSLAPGKYSFSVYCLDGFGMKSAIKSIHFEIFTPFWQKTWFVVLAILLFSFLFYTYVKLRLKKQQQLFEKEKAVIQMERDKANLEKQMIDLEQKALRLQMNPHFIFNALNTIKGYYSEGDTVNASNYISRFSKLLRKLLESTDQIIPLSNEIEMLDLYIGLTKTRYKNKFEYELFVDEKLNRNETAIPTLLLQPIVENAIIHGLAPKEEKGLLKVSFLKKENNLECSIEDNGIGRAASKKRQINTKEYESKAIAITKERIALFGENPEQSSFEIIDLEVNSAPSGTKVIITIPLISIW